ncbi:MAG TPA: tetratricopeptide repeat protein [Streptosporangiaceae bacterium]|nr:tetratricopeptide repeat protein [Streptosporangiaceae bacterium]
MDGSYVPGEGKGASWANEISGTVVGQSVQAGSIHGGIQFNIASGVPLPTPAQLPVPGFFVGREQELADLRRLTQQGSDQDRTRLVVISGPGGVGKTTLALYWLHQIRDNYPDGQLFVDLRGFSGDGRPMPTSEPLERFLRALGIGRDGMPVNLDEQAALFRSLTTGRRLVMLLDNAASAAQIRPLLPGPGPALVVVTTRQRLSGLAMEGARFFGLTPMDELGAVELLNRMVGSDRIQPELNQALFLVSLCGGLPLAVCASGARLVARSRWTVARVVEELTDETHRLSTLSAEDDVSVKAVFDLSYRALPTDAARLYRLLGMHPGPDFNVATAAAMAEITHAESARLIDYLVGANLLEEGAGDRFRFHDLLRLHAREKLMETESRTARKDTFAQLVDYYLGMAAAADRAILPGRWRLGGYFDGPPRTSFDSGATALEWLELERANITATLRQAHQEEMHEAVWQICEALWGLFLIHKHYRLWIECHELGVAAARACANTLAHARMLEALAYAYINLQDFAPAVEYCRQALRLERDSDHPLGEASALEYLGVAELGSSRNECAIDLFTMARDIHQRLGRPRGVALMTRHIGEALRQAGRYNDAIEHFTDALNFFSANSERYHVARTLTRLGKTYLLASRLDDAERTLHSALETALEIDARHEAANVHVVLAQLSAAIDEPAKERSHLERALTIYAELGAPQAEEINNQLARRPPRPSSPDSDSSI